MDQTVIGVKTAVGEGIQEALQRIVHIPPSVIGGI
jgi:hypothetical protein